MFYFTEVKLFSGIHLPRQDILRFCNCEELLLFNYYTYSHGMDQYSMVVSLIQAYTFHNHIRAARLSWSSQLKA